MYYEFFRLKESPFNMEPRAEAVGLSAIQREALSNMILAVEQREGWALILGEPGTGKTTLVQALIRELGQDAQTAVINHPRMEVMDFYRYLGFELGIEERINSKGEFLVALRGQIRKCRQQGQALLILVDEAHALDYEMLEELRLLGNLDQDSPRTLHIFLLGQPELARLLSDPKSAALLQRMRRRTSLKPFNELETAAYVRHRLKVAGGEGNLFEPAALSVLYGLSNGVPRIINRICDDSLAVAYLNEKKTVDYDSVVEAAKLHESVLDFGQKKPVIRADTLPAAQAVRRPAMMAEVAREPSPAQDLAPPPEPESEVAIGEGPGRPVDLLEPAKEKPRPQPEATSPEMAKERLRRPAGVQAAPWGPIIEPPRRQGFWQRLLVLLIVLAAAAGVYWWLQSGGFEQIRHLLRKKSVTGTLPARRSQARLRSLFGPQMTDGYRVVLGGLHGFGPRPLIGTRGPADRLTSAPILGGYHG